MNSSTDLQIGYCTNVHAGGDWETTQANLARYAPRVKEQYRPAAPMGIGLWLSAASAEKLVREDKVGQFADWLAATGLVPFTLNGFPYGDFHQRVVKHRVYEPTWYEPARLDYTLSLAKILDRILPAGLEGSISTLPLAWGQPAATPQQFQAAAAQLRKLAAELHRLEQEQGRLIHVCIEPEPGCVLQVSDDIVRFFEDYLFGGEDEVAVRRHIRVCHDVCHAVVMFEEQADVLAKFRRAGIGVGKVQVSAAVILPLDRIPTDQRADAVAQLAGFKEERYLHQTVKRRSPGEPTRFYEDLPPALADAGVRPLQGEWRVHFHVPVYLERFGLLEASRPQILECLRAAAADPEIRHFEVETYAWGVLPAELQQPDLAAGIADELKWFTSVARG